MNSLLNKRSELLKINDVIGEDFGTEDFSLFLFSLVKMQAPQTIVELGTGLGISALWMALAAKENGSGHVWTVDNFEWFARRQDRGLEIVNRLSETGIGNISQADAATVYAALSAHLELDPTLTFVKANIDLNEQNHFDLYSFGQKNVDLLFSDFDHGGPAILKLLAHFIPKLSPSASVIIHSASTAWSSYLLIEQLVSQLNSGKIPKALQDFSSLDLAPFVQSRRISVMHLVEQKDRNQNSAAWLRFEQADVFPSPRVRMRR